MDYIFISYSHKDKDYAHKLHQHLFEHGLDAWMDDRIDYGSRWTHEIERRLKDCSVFILIMSPDSYNSDWVQNELQLARKLNKKIYTLLLEGDNWWYLETVQYFDVKNGELPSSKFFASLANMVPQSKDKNNSNISINVAGNVQGNIVVGNDNKVRSTIEVAKKETQKKEKPVVNATPLQGGALSGKAVSKREGKSREEQKKEKPAPVSRIGNPTYKRAFGIGGIIFILFTLIFGGFGLNYLIGNLFSRGAPTIPILPTNTLPPILILPTNTLSPTLILPTNIPPPTLILPTITSPINPIVGSIWPQTIDYMILFYVPAGTFTMGSDTDSDEQPIHQVDLDAFWIDQTEVTNAMYAKCVDAGKCNQPSSTSHFSDSSYANHPVVYVNWNQASAYCTWAERRLPTEAEWEKAARGTKVLTYPWGDGIDCNKANYTSSCVGDTSPVKSYSKGVSPYGAYDMAGNVWEWVSDLYSDTYYQSSPSSNPLGPDSGIARVLRGGSWSNVSFNARSADRLRLSPDYTNNDIGFRCVRSLP